MITYSLKASSLTWIHNPRNCKAMRKTINYSRELVNIQTLKTMRMMRKIHRISINSLNDELSYRRQQRTIVIC